MARFYISYEELSWYVFKQKEHNQEVFWAPPGEDPQYYVRVYERKGQELFVLGSATGQLSLLRGDILGYEMGNVWRVPMPHEFPDPIKRLLAEKRVRQKVLWRESSQPLPWREVRILGSPEKPADIHMGELAPLVLGPSSTTLVRETLGKTKSGLGSCVREYSTLGGQALILRSLCTWRQCGKMVQWTKISTILVRPKVDREEVAHWLDSQIPNYVFASREPAMKCG